jgi:hypothetical protein
MVLISGEIVMSNWARIDDANVVQEVIDFDPTGKYPSQYSFVPCTSDVTSRWVYDAKKKSFTPPVLPTATDAPELPPERIGEELDKFPPPTVTP